MQPAPESSHRETPNEGSTLTFWSQRPTVGYQVRLWLALAFILWATCPWGPAQPYWRLSAAFRHLPRVEAALNRHQELADVKVGVGTANGGMLGVHGRLPRAELAALAEAVVEGTRPPVTVQYFFHVTDARTGELRRLPTRIVRR